MLVRSVGGGEPWTSQIVPELNPSSNDTITQILGARGGVNAATAVRDYEILDTRLTFQVRPEDLLQTAAVKSFQLLFR